MRHPGTLPKRNIAPLRRGAIFDALKARVYIFGFSDADLPIAP